MYEVSQLVVYGMHGVCRIVDTESRTVDHKAVSYFVLEPLAQAGTRFYLPCHNSAALAKLRPLISPERLQSILQEEVAENVLIPEENARKLYYRKLISAPDVAQMLAMVRCLYRHRSQLVSQGRRLHICDENFLRDAERALTGELSYVLQIPPAEVPAYMRSKMESEE